MKIISAKASLLQAIGLLLLHGLPAFSPLKTKASFSDSIFNKYAFENSFVKPVFFIVKTKPCASNITKVFKVIRTITPQVHIIKINGAFTAMQKSNCTDKIAPASDMWKLSPTLEQYIKNNKEDKKTLSLTISANDISLLLQNFNKKMPLNKIIYIFKEQHAAVVQCSAKDFAKHLLPDSLLVFADKYEKAQTEVQLIGYNRSLHNINLTTVKMPAANGNGITIGIKENRMDETDIDLQKRITPSLIAAAAVDNHATVVATLAGGAGNSFYSGKGLAWKCNFFSTSYSILFPDDVEPLTQNNVSVQNHSYGTVIQNFYGAEAAAYDAQTWANKKLLHIFSSGNKGLEASAQGYYKNITGYNNITGNFKMAKNIITVAATDTGSNIAPFSSSGPLYDGRLAPQITALGPNGTSDAAAIISGAAALIQQVYKDSNSMQLPAAALVKAILYNSADDIYNKGIDYKSGFGSLNIYNALQALMQKKYITGILAHNEVFIKNIAVPVNAANFTITLAWTDTTASINTNEALINDLDIELIQITTGKIYKPWCLSTIASADSLNLLPERKRDSINTAEQISIELPASGNYQIKISGKKIITFNKQEFSIAYNWDTTGTFEFKNPVNADDIDVSENPNLSIKWHTVLADTNSTGNLLVTVNNGNSWLPVAAGIKLNKKKINWLIPYNSAVARFRMDCSFGSFFSAELIIAPLTSLNIAFLCKDSAGIFWNKHPYASGYQLFALTDSAYLKPIRMVTDTFALLQTNNNINIYAVKPIVANGLFASRSIAIDIRNQGVNCFYKTLLAENRTDKIELILELSTQTGIDSIAFEKISSNSIFQKKLATVSSIRNLFVYSVFDDAPVSGSNFYRCKIWFKNGSFVYTATVAVVSNASKFIIFYPNPVKRNETLYYQLNNFMADLNIRLFDVQGRILKLQPIGSSGKIETAGLPPGIFIFTIAHSNGQIMQTGKLIISR